MVYNYELIHATFFASDLGHCTEGSRLHPVNSSQILPLNGLIGKLFRNTLDSLCLIKEQSAFTQHKYGS